MVRRNRRIGLAMVSLRRRLRQPRTLNQATAGDRPALLGRGPQVQGQWIQD